MTIANADFSVLVSTTLKNYQTTLADNVSQHIPTLNYFKTKGMVLEDGGSTLVEPLMHEFVPVTSYSGAETISLANQEGISAAEYNWKNIATSVVILHDERNKNSGSKQQVLNLVKAKTMQAEASLENAVSEMLFGDGTGNGGKDILGFEAIISQTPSTGVLGGIDASINTFWRNIANTSVGSFASGGVAAISTALRQTQRGTDRVDLLVTGSTIFGYMMSTAYNRSFLDNPKLADLGFTALKFEGVDVIYDANCPADRIYGVNSRWLKMKVHPKANFTIGKFIEPADQFLEAAKINLMAQLVTGRRQAHFVLSGITA